MCNYNRIIKIFYQNIESIISVFAGRIADTGIDPIPEMKECLNRMKGHPKSKLLWASSRELLNIVQANDSGCHIITVGHDLLNKMKELLNQ